MLGIRGKWIIEDWKTVHKDSILVLDGHKVVDIIGQEDLPTYGEIKLIDKSDSIIMPGFINSHMHMYGVLAHGIPKLENFTDFTGFLENYWWPYIEDRIGLEEVRVTSEYRCRQLLEYGVTSVCDTLEAPFVGENTLVEQAKILEKYGLNAILSLEASQRVSEENALECIRENLRLSDWLRENGSKTRAIMCTHTSFTCSGDFLLRAKELANERGLGLQFHLSESSYEGEMALKNYGLKPAVYLEKLGILDENTLASQCVKVDSEEIEILSRNKVRVVHNPLSNCEVGGGFAPVVEMLEAGINVSLGTDGYIDDFFEVMRAAFLLHKSVHENTEVMPGDLVFKMATENGAKNMGLEKRGRLGRGCYGDFIVLDNEIPTPINRENIFEQLIIEGRSSYIDQVYIDGDLKVDRGRVIIGDRARTYRELASLTEKFWDFKGE